MELQNITFKKNFKKFSQYSQKNIEGMIL